MRILQVTDLHMLHDIEAGLKDAVPDIVSRWHARMKLHYGADAPVSAVTNAPPFPTADVSSAALTSWCRDKTFSLIKHLKTTTSSELLVLTGDIFDGRGVTDAESQLRPLIRAMDELAGALKTQWLFVPGNHEGDWGAVSRELLFSWICRECSNTVDGRCAADNGTTSGGEEREELPGSYGAVEIRSFHQPATVSGEATRLPATVESSRASDANAAVEHPTSPFDRGVILHEKNVLLLFFDARTNTPPYHLSNQAVRAAHNWLATRCDGQIKSQDEFDKFTKLVFIHEPLRITQQEDSSAKNPAVEVQLVAGLPSDCAQEQYTQDADGLLLGLCGSFGVHVFCGHNHHADEVLKVDVKGGSSRKEKDFLVGLGRNGSYYPPSEHEGNKALPFPRGARVFECRAAGDFATWTVDENGEQGEVASV